MQTPQQIVTLYTQYLRQQPSRKPPFGLYEPVDYIMQLGGKRLRPVLLLMSYNLFKEDLHPALPAAHAVELFHNFTLLHDDIMDKAPLRRGQPTVHIKYGINAGILSGDVMLILAYDFLSRSGLAARWPDLIGLFNRFAIEVCEGQQYDIEFESAATVSISEYLKMIEMKTAALIGGAMRMGAMIGSAGEQDAERLQRCGRQLGIAFQLMDDILDTFGDPAKFGKKPGGDIAQNKKTFLLLKAKELARGSAAQALTEALESDSLEEDVKISRVTSIYQELGVRQLAKREMQTFVEQAFGSLAQVSVADERKEPFKKLVTDLTDREI